MRLSRSSSRQTMMASKVRALSHRPRIMVSRPASMRLAMAISPSRESSSTEPISRRYMRTGSSVRSKAGLPSVATTADSSRATTAPPSAAVSSPCSSFSTTLTPISESMARVSSICSEVTSSDGSTLFSSSIVT